MERTARTKIAARWMARRSRVVDGLRTHGWTLPLYLILALIFTYPTVLHLTTAIGGRFDALENFWNLWWTRQALLERMQNPFHATIMFYPFGLTLYFHTYNFANALLSLPLQVCCGTAAAYNLLNIFAYALAGIGAYALAWHLVHHRGAAFIAGLIFGFSPYMAFHLAVGQPFMLSLEWLPLYLLALLKGLRGRWPWLLVAGALLVVIGFTDWHYTVFALLWTLLAGLVELWRERNIRHAMRVVAKLALVGGIFTLGILPLLAPMLAELMLDKSAVKPLDQSILHSADLLAFVLPSVYHPLWGAWAGKYFYGVMVQKGIAGGVVTLGFVPLALAICGALAARRRAALFVVGFLTFFVLALGPYLQVGGFNTSVARFPIPLPYLLFHQLPFMDILRIPSRFAVGAILAMAVLAAIGIAALERSRRLARLSPQMRLWLMGGVAVLIAFEYLPRPVPMTPVTANQVPPFYRRVAATPGSGAILEVPYFEHTSLFYQTYHDRPTVGGRIARQKLHPWFLARFFDGFFHQSTIDPDIGIDESPAAVRAALQCEGIQYVVFYKQGQAAGPGEEVSAPEDQIFAGSAPVADDGVLRAYEVQAAPNRQMYWTPDPDGWYAPELGTDGFRHRWVKGTDGTLQLYPCHGNLAVLDFSVMGLDRPRSLSFMLNGENVGSAQAPANISRPVRLLLQLQPGENHFEISSRESATTPQAGDDPRHLSFNISEVSLTAP